VEFIESADNLKGTIRINALDSVLDNTAYFKRFSHCPIFGDSVFILGGTNLLLCSISGLRDIFEHFQLEFITLGKGGTAARGCFSLDFFDHARNLFDWLFSGGAVGLNLLDLMVLLVWLGLLLGIRIIGMLLGHLFLGI